MTPLKIKTLGGRGELCQQNRIDEGFLLLGHELVEENPDIIYVNDYNHHGLGIELKKKYPSAKLILNTLDLPYHCKEYREIIDQLSVNFYFANALTTISETVKEQMLSIFPHSQKSGIEVIYQPVKPVKPLGLKRNRKLMVVGRVADPNKRIILALQSAGFSNTEVDIYGPDNIVPSLSAFYQNIVTYKGLVSDFVLNKAYNSHAAVLITSLNEGINLPLIESIITKTPVICCKTMTTSKEFCPEEFTCDDNVFNISKKIEEIFNPSESMIKSLEKYSEQYKVQFDKKTVASNIINLYEKIK